MLQTDDCHQARDEADARVDVAQQVCRLEQLRIASRPASICNTCEVRASPMYSASLCAEQMMCQEAMHQELRAPWSACQPLYSGMRL